MLHALKQSVKKAFSESALNYYRNIRNRIWVKQSFMRNGGIESIELETVNRCNGTCPFCPVNVHQPQREYAKMPEELFRKIIDDLAEMNYSNGIALFSNNEPFLDERIIDFHRYANEKLPKAAFWLFTNGTLLTLEKLLEIIPFLDALIIDNYNDAKEINTPELKRVYDYLQEHHELDGRVVFDFRLENVVGTSRGGQAPNKLGMNDTRAMNVLCTLPFRQFIIRPTGEVSLCCNDALGKYTMGDLKTQTILEVWNSEKYRAVRQEMLAHGRRNLMLCRDCDTVLGLQTTTKRQRP